MKAKLIAVMFSLLVSTTHSAEKLKTVLEEDMIVASQLCTSNKELYAYDRDMKICYEIEYGYVKGLVYAQLDTLKGTFFGFCEITLYNSENRITCAVDDLIKNLKSNYKANLCIMGYRTLFKFPRKLSF